MADADSVEIKRLGAQGDGVADRGDGPVYVRGALPGERVAISVIGDRAILKQIVSPSAERVAPACQHFGVCGGCVAQHMGPQLYAGWKREAVIQAFRHRGLDAPVAELVEIAPSSRRRVVLEARRSGVKIALGFYAAGTHDLVDLNDCRIMRPELLDALPRIREMAAMLLPSAGAARFTVLATQTGLDINITGLSGMPEAAELASLGRSGAVRGVARLTVNGEIALLDARPVLRFDGVEVEVPPGDFVQSSSEAEALIGALVKGAAGKAKRVADLFAGVGTFSFVLARKARVLAIDSASEAIAALKAAAAGAAGCKPIEVRVRDLMREPLSRLELAGFDAVVFDPPRIGALAQAEALGRSQVPVVIAVSCNPATLARDVRVLVDGGYELDAVTPIDQFVWSAHVEVVAVLRRPKTRR